MRDCVFLLADGTMEAMFQGFFSRENFHLSLRIRAITFNSREDIVSGINDPRTYTYAHELLRSYQYTHHYALIVMDREWEGSPPSIDEIRDSIRRNMIACGWHEERFEVIVIDPELENWIWQESPHIVEAFGYEDTMPLRQWLRDQEPSMWLDGDLKPVRPKEAVEAVLRITRIPRSSAIYRQIVERVSIKRCADPAFALLCDCLRKWFPVGVTL
jgi:hypothetical protein